MHHAYYNTIFPRVAGDKNVGWIAKDIEGRVVKADAAGQFAQMVGLAQAELLGSTTSKLPWSNAAQDVDATDTRVRAGEVREAVAIYWHPLENQWRRVVSAKWLVEATSLDIDGDGLVYCMAMDISGLQHHKKNIVVLTEDIKVDWAKECVLIDENVLSRSHGVCLSYYLDRITQLEIAEKTGVTVKTVEKRIAHLKNVLMPLDRSCDNLYMLCRKYGIRAALEEKRDWFDRQAVIWPITNVQWRSITNDK